MGEPIRTLREATDLLKSGATGVIDGRPINPDEITGRLGTGGRPKVEYECPACGDPYGANEMKEHLPVCRKNTGPDRVTIAMWLEMYKQHVKDRRKRRRS